MTSAAFVAIAALFATTVHPSSGFSYQGKRWKFLLPEHVMDQLYQLDSQSRLNPLAVNAKIDELLRNQSRPLLEQLDLPHAYDHLPFAARWQIREILLNKNLQYSDKERFIRGIILGLPEDQRPIVEEKPEHSKYFEMFSGIKYQVTFSFKLSELKRTLSKADYEMLMNHLGDTRLSVDQKLDRVEEIMARQTYDVLDDLFLTDVPIVDREVRERFRRLFLDRSFWRWRSRDGASEGRTPASCSFPAWCQQPARPERKLVKSWRRVAQLKREMLANNRLAPGTHLLVIDNRNSQVIMLKNGRKVPGGPWKRPLAELEKSTTPSEYSPNLVASSVAPEKNLNQQVETQLAQQGISATSQQFERKELGPQYLELTTIKTTGSQQKEQAVTIAEQPKVLETSTPLGTQQVQPGQPKINEYSESLQKQTRTNQMNQINKDNDEQQQQLDGGRILNVHQLFRVPVHYIQHAPESNYNLVAGQKIEDVNHQPVKIITGIKIRKPEAHNLPLPIKFINGNSNAQIFGKIGQKLEIPLQNDPADSTKFKRTTAASHLNLLPIIESPRPLAQGMKLLPTPDKDSHFHQKNVQQVKKEVIKANTVAKKQKSADDVQQVKAVLDQMTFEGQEPFDGHNNNEIPLKKIVEDRRVPGPLPSQMPVKRLQPPKRHQFGEQEKKWTETDESKFLDSWYQHHGVLRDQDETHASIGQQIGQADVVKKAGVENNLERKVAPNSVKLTTENRITQEKTTLPDQVKTQSVGETTWDKVEPSTQKVKVTSPIKLIFPAAPKLDAAQTQSELKPPTVLIDQVAKEKLILRFLGNGNTKLELKQLSSKEVQEPEVKLAMERPTSSSDAPLGLKNVQRFPTDNDCRTYKLWGVEMELCPPSWIPTFRSRP